MKRFLIILSALLIQASALVTEGWAQPTKSRVANQRTGQTAGNRGGSKTTTSGYSRADLMFPTAVSVPEEMVWRRDIYRTLDLTKDENAALYFPTEPQGKQINLFTLIFQLLNQGKLPAYEYKLDGVEDFSATNRMHFKDMLDRYHIFYEVSGNSIKVEPSDVPSAEVLSYNVKESSYYDQNTATYHSRITAICPVLHRSDDFSMDMRKYPMFWIKYEDLETYLNGHTIMTSNVNNAAQMSTADFFATNHYVGTIYMTTNMQNKSIMQTVGDDAEKLKKEQARIEKEMKDFEQHIWQTPVDSAELARRDSIANLSPKARKAAAKAESAKNKAARSARTSSSSKSSKSQSSSSSTPRVSVRRQRH